MREMLRIHFSREDLLRVRITPTYGPLAEALFGLNAMRAGRLSVLPPSWRRNVMRSHPSWAAPLGELLAPEFPLDLFTAIGRVSSAGEGLEALSAISGHRL